MITRDSERLYSSMRFLGDGTTKRVSLTFSLNRDDGLAVDFGEGLVTSGYTIDRDTNPVVVIFEEPLPLGKTITIRRLTDISEVKHIFQWLGNAQGGSDFTAKNMDENFEQITRASQDAMDAQTLATETLEEMAGIRDDALDARDRAKVSAEEARSSEVNAKVSETNAKASEINSKASEDLVIENADKARLSELNAKESEVNAKVSETNSKASEVASKESEINASSSESNAMQYAQTSINSANEAVTSAFNAKVSEIQASSSEVNAKESEELAEKWATNPEDVVVVDDKYSAYHWAMKAEDSAGGLTQEVQEALDLKRDLTNLDFGNTLIVHSKDDMNWAGTLIKRKDNSNASYLLYVEDVANQDGHAKMYTFSKSGGTIGRTTFPHRLGTAMHVEDVLNSTGDSTEFPMNQKVVTDNLNSINTALYNKRDKTDSDFKGMTVLTEQVNVGNSQIGARLQAISNTVSIQILNNVEEGFLFTSDFPRKTGTIAHTSDIPTSSKLGSEQTVTGTGSDFEAAMRNAISNIPPNCVFCGGSGGTTWTARYRPITRI